MYLLYLSGRNALQYQHEEHRFHVDDDQLNQEIRRDYSVTGGENVNHQHREINLRKDENNEEIFIAKSSIPIAVSGMAMVVVSVAIRNGPCTDKPQP